MSDVELMLYIYTVIPLKSDCLPQETGQINVYPTQNICIVEIVLMESIEQII